MKFLLVSPFTNASGSAIRFWNIARSLYEQGHEVVFTDRQAKNVRSLHSCGAIRYYRCPTSGMLLPDIVISFFYYCFILILHRDCTIYYALKPAPNNCFPALFARCFGKKILLDVDDLDFAYLSNGPGRTLFKRFFTFFPSFFHLVTYHTPNLALYLKKNTGISPNRLYYCAQGVSPEFLHTVPPSPENPPSRTLIYVATLGITSDFSDLVPGIRRLCRKFPDLSMSVVGDGCRRKEFERMIKNAEIDKNVSFTGTIPHDKLPAFIQQHRIGINYMRPSPVNQCRAILKIREYLACGLHVICNDVGDVALFSDHIAIASTIDSLFDSLTSLISQPFRFNQSGRTFIEQNYRWSTIIADLQKRIATI